MIQTKQHTEVTFVIIEPQKIAVKIPPKVVWKVPPPDFEIPDEPMDNSDQSLLTGQKMKSNKVVTKQLNTSKMTNFCLKVLPVFSLKLGCKPFGIWLFKNINKECVIFNSNY